MNLRTFTPAAWIAIACGVAVLSAVAFLVVMNFLHAPQRAAEARAGGMIAEGQVATAGDAAVIADNTVTAAAASEALSQESTNAILNAPGADQRLDPAFNRTLRERLCQRESNRHSAECVRILRGSDPSPAH